MADNTGIEWTRGDDGTPGATWNPTTGCDKVSAGCGLPRFEGDDTGGCYAMAMAKRLKAMGAPHYQTDGDPRTSGLGFGVAVHEDALSLPLRWRKPRRIFVNSMSDLLHARVPREFVTRVFAVMAATPQHTYQILTKRPERAERILTDLCRCGAGHAAGVHFRSAMSWAASRANPVRVAGMPDDAERQVYHEAGWPLRNVWLGTSVEDQDNADRRLPHLLDTPAAVRWVSAEPLLGPVDLTPYLPGLDWVVIGGESGPGARPMEPAWARSLRDQCVSARVPFFFKQWGSWAPNGARGIGRFGGRERLVGPVIDDMGHREIVERQRHKSTRVLDGRTWDQYPNTSTTTVGATA